MPFTLESPLIAEDLGFDEIIDVRSPAEFAIDHIPGAVNLPVLDDTERAEVGTIYVRDSRFRARRVGAAIVARNVARHLDEYLSDKPAKYGPLIYCWRGGQRSGSMALILRQIGWQADTLAGGYRSYRRLVAQHLYENPLPTHFHILDGNTGCAKTELLGLLAGRGVQTIDLEGLAHHRGSLFGQMPDGKQPTQKMFETRLLQELGRLDPARPVVVEGESSTIGKLALPPQVWTAMLAAPRILLSAPLEARASYLARTYRDICEDAERLGKTLDCLIPLQGHARVDDWRKLAANGEYSALAAALMLYHYDPAYQNSRAARPQKAAAALHMETLDPSALDKAAAQIAETLLSTPAPAEPAPARQSAR